MTSQQQRLANGTPYVGQLGELAYDADSDRIQCHLCGGWYRAIGHSHLRCTHGWTLAEYRQAFRLPVQLASCSRGVSEQLSANALERVQRGEFGGGVYLAPWRMLAAQHPGVVRELDPERNDKALDPTAIAAKSNRKLWWRCPDCGHRWQATVGSRAAGAGCPACYDKRRREQGPRHVSVAQSLQALHPALAAEWDRARNAGLDPRAISPKSKQKVWWRCGACGHGWPATVQNRASGHGCPKCGVKRRARTQSRVPYERSLAALHPGLLAELHPARNKGLDPKQLGARSTLKLWWCCATCGHDWDATAASRTYHATGCPACHRATHSPKGASRASSAGAAASG